MAAIWALTAMIIVKLSLIHIFVLGIPMLVMLRKSRRIRLEMLYNNETITDEMCIRDRHRNGYYL